VQSLILASFTLSIKKRAATTDIHELKIMQTGRFFQGSITFLRYSLNIWY